MSVRVYEQFVGPAPWPTTSPKRAAKRLGVRIEMVERMCRKGELEAIRTASANGRARHWLIRESDVDALVERLRG